MDLKTPTSAAQLPPLTIWLVTINREVTREEFQRFMQSLPPALRKQYKTGMQDARTLKEIIRNLLPRILMKEQRIPEDRWKVDVTNTGKSYIDSPDLSRRTRKIMGYSTATAQNVVGFAFAFGRKHQVVNLGIDLMRVPTEIDAEKFIEAHSHCLAPTEETYVVPALPSDVKLRRLCIMLTLKRAYTQALGQPPGFDLSRIAVDLPKTLRVDGAPQLGWEFRLFVLRAGEETYQVAAAIHRGWPDRSEFVFADPQKDASDKRSRWLALATVRDVAAKASSQYQGHEEMLGEKPIL